MIFRIVWLRIKPLSSQGFLKLTKAIAADQFTQGVTSGFIVDAERKSSLEARFIQTRNFTETVADPFGNESKFERTEYTQIKFTLFDQAPHLEIINPARNLTPLINRLGELCEGKSAIYLPEQSVSELMQTMAEMASSAKFTGLLISNLQLSPTATAKVLIKSSEDVKKLLPKFIGQRSHTIKEAQLEILTPSGCQARITIKENCRLSVQTEKDEESVRFLRQMVHSLI